MIAIIAMTIDHFSDLIYPQLPMDAAAIFLHIIGFFIYEGYYYTRNIKKYILRLLVFAFISHFTYCFAFGINVIPFSTGIFNQTSVMYPLFIAVLVMWLQDTELKINNFVKHIIIFILVWSAFPADWSCIAVLAIMGMYKNRGNLKKQMINMMIWVILYSIVSFFFVNRVFELIQPFVILVYPLLEQYNGERGKAKWTKWLFYIYYPAHLVIIGILRITLYGNVPLLF